MLLNETISMELVSTTLIKSARFKVNIPCPNEKACRLLVKKYAQAPARIASEKDITTLYRSNGDASSTASDGRSIPAKARRGAAAGL